MITQSIQPPAVEKYTNIALYRDNEDPYIFYYLNNQPRISVDKTTGLPKFNFMIIGIKKSGADGDTQSGHLTMTVDLSLTDTEMKYVIYTVTQYVQNPNFKELVKNDYPKYDFDKTAIKTVEKISNRFTTRFEVKSVGNPRQVVVKPIDFESGTASLSLISSDYEGNFTFETKPSLFGDCYASFIVNFNSQQAQKLYNLLISEQKKGPIVNLMASVRYELSFKTVMPFLATGSIKYESIYEEIHNFCKYNTGSAIKESPKYKYIMYRIPGLKTPIKTNLVACTNGKDLYISKEGLDNYLRNSFNAKEILDISIKNYDQNTNSEQYEQLILNALSSHIADQVCDKLFEKVAPLNPSDIQLSAPDVDMKDSNELNLSYDFSYRLRDRNQISFQDNKGIRIEKYSIGKDFKNPQTSLEVLLNNFNIESLVQTFDSSDAYFKEMVIPVKIDKTNFGGDIAMISVRVIYKDKKGAVKLNQVLNFDEDDPSPKNIKVNLERNDKHELIDTFYYQTRITYRGFDVYEKNVPDNAKWTPIKEARGFGEGIYIPYRDLRNLCVECEAGDVAWDDVIEKLVVEFKYKDAPDKDGATKEMKLTRDNPKDTWNCFMYKDSDTYQYRIHYFYQDGTDDWSQVFEATPTTGKLIVNDKLTGIFRRTFQRTNTTNAVEKIRVFVKCQGKEECSDWLYKDDQWVWERRLKEDGTITYQYKYQYYYANGDDSEYETDWTAPIPMNSESDSQYININLNIDQIKLTIDGSAIDWNKWHRVYLHIKYDDDANNKHYNDENFPPIRLDSSNCVNDINLLLTVVDKSIRPKIYVEYIPIDGPNIISSDVVTANPLVILPHNAPPKE